MMFLVGHKQLRVIQIADRAKLLSKNHMPTATNRKGSSLEAVFEIFQVLPLHICFINLFLKAI